MARCEEPGPEQRCQMALAQSPWGGLAKLKQNRCKGAPYRIFEKAVSWKGPALILHPEVTAAWGLLLVVKMVPECLIKAIDTAYCLLLQLCIIFQQYHGRLNCCRTKQLHWAQAVTLFILWERAVWWSRMSQTELQLSKLP